MKKEFSNQIFETVYSSEEVNKQLWEGENTDKQTTVPQWLVQSVQRIDPVQFPQSEGSQLERWNPQQPSHHPLEEHVERNCTSQQNSVSVNQDSAESVSELNVDVSILKNLEKENKQLKEDLRSQKETFGQAVLEFATAREKSLSHVEKELLGLSVMIAESLIQREIQTDPSLHVSMAQAALKALGAESKVMLRASEQAYQSMLETFGSSEIEFEGVPVQLTVDTTIKGLGCVVENEFSQVDGRVHERLASILRSFQNQWKKNHEEGVF